MYIQAGALVDKRYRLVSRLGEGGMGTVWSAVREADDGRFALKVLKVSSVDHVRRLLREARIAERLRHPNVVRVVEVIARGGAAPPVLVLELLRGESLRDRLLRGVLPLGQAAAILLHVVDALASAHAGGVVHRDVKPENVFLHQTAEGETIAKVLDFGIAKVVDTSEMVTAGMTQTGAVLGTPWYMAPEQIFGEANIDARADVWALGILLYECVVGAKPFDGENYGQIFKAITLGQPTLVDSPVTALVRTMLASEREGRPGLDAVRSELAAWADASIGDPPPAVVDAFAATLAAGASFRTPEAVALAEDGAAQRRRRPSRGWVIAGVLALLSVTGGAAWLRPGEPAAAAHAASNGLAAAASPSAPTAPAALAAPASPVAPVAPTSPVAATSPVALAAAAPPAPAPALLAFATVGALAEGAASPAARAHTSRSPAAQRPASPPVTNDPAVPGGRRLPGGVRDENPY